MPEIVQPQSQIVEQLIENKLAAINQLMRSNQFTTRNDSSRGDALSSVVLAIQDYLTALQSSDTSTQVTLVKRGNINSSAVYNGFWSSINNDLNVSYAEANNIGQLLTNHHNYIMADIQNTLIQLKTANSSIENYTLLTSTPVGNQQTFIEKFTDLSKVDVNSPLLAAVQANIDTIEGIVTLGISASNPVTTDEVGNIVIGSANSNGAVFGSITLLDIINSGGLRLFQYELTSLTPVTQKLVLDFTIKLDALQIINFIRIIPNNFGTTTWPTITSLDISQDGVNFTSIREVLLGVSNDPTQFVLAPYTSNFAGEGRYSFLPERVMFVHFTIEQTTPYFDPSRNLFRWAIGIKDIELIGNQYVPVSQVVSLPYTFAAGVSKVAIDGDELPQNAFVDTSLSSPTQVKHDISVDDGMTWHAISPEYMQGTDPSAPEILNVNNVDSQLDPTATSSLNTTALATSVRYRLTLNQNPSIINDSELLPYFSPVVRNTTLKVFTQEVI